MCNFNAVYTFSIPPLISNILIDYPYTKLPAFNFANSALASLHAAIASFNSFTFLL
jgi:hypothetical protein